MSEERTERACGGCTMCCFTHGVENVDNEYKKAESWCKHCDIGRGCRVYQTRPQDCVTFTCMWLRGIGAEEHRPDKTGVVLNSVVIPELPTALVMTGTVAGALESDYATRLAMTYVGRGIPVLREHCGGQRSELWHSERVRITPRVNVYCEFFGIKLVLVPTNSS